MKKIAIIVLVVAAAFVYCHQTRKDYYDYLIISGATPLAVARQVPSDIRLEIDGLVKKPYRFTGDALNALATTRIRTLEVSPLGEFLGAYVYVGIPVFNILEGIAPGKPEEAAFDRPLDIMVTFHSTDGKKASFSYNELVMTGDSCPITLAYSREPIMPTKESTRKVYTGNRFPEDISGLRLICPKEPDTTRYLDQVVRISLNTIPVNDSALPPQKKGHSCVSSTITCMDNTTQVPAVFEGISRTLIKRWIKLGHGRGYHGTVRAEGFDLRSFLSANFNDPDPDDFFLFTACDGYRALFSGHEIFTTDEGSAMMIVDRIDGKIPKTGYMAAPTADYFCDRAVWGLTHVVRLRPEQIAR